MSRLAILLAAYNGEPYIAQQLDSLFAQTCQEFTIYIHDDGSGDGTLDVIKEYIRRYPGRIHLLEYEPAGGAKENFLSLLRRAEADYYMFCDEDDWWLPEKIECSMKRMKEIEGQDRENPCLVFSDMSVTDASLQITHPSYLQYRKKNPKDISLQALLTENTAAGCTILCNRALRKLAMDYEDSNHIFMHDWWLMVTAAALGRISWIEQPLVLYRQHGSNTVGAHTDSRLWIKRIIKNITEGKQLTSSREGILLQRAMAGELLGIIERLEIQSDAELSAHHTTCTAAANGDETGIFGSYQASESNSVPVCRKEDRELLQSLTEIAEKPWLQRVSFYRKHHLLKQDKKSFWKLLLV